MKPALASLGHTVPYPTYHTSSNVDASSINTSGEATRIKTTSNESETRIGRLGALQPSSKQKVSTLGDWILGYPCFMTKL